MKLVNISIVLRILPWSLACAAVGCGAPTNSNANWVDTTVTGDTGGLADALGVDAEGDGTGRVDAEGDAAGGTDDTAPVDSSEDASPTDDGGAGDSGGVSDDAVVSDSGDGGATEDGGAVDSDDGGATEDGGAVDSDDGGATEDAAIADVSDSGGATDDADPGDAADGGGADDSMDANGADINGIDTTGSDTTGSDTTGSDTTGSDTSGNDVAGSDTSPGDATGPDADTASNDATASDSGDGNGDGSSDGGGGGSCAGNCGPYDANAACQCDSACVNYKDCCADYQALCTCAKDEDCADNDLCTIDSCKSDNVCSNSPAKSCDDKDPCTADSCDPKSGACVNKAASGASCNDNDVCTDTDTCSNGACAGKPKVCNDGDACTVDACDKAKGCTSAPAANGTACTDGDPCTLATTCQSGACKGKDVCSYAKIFDDPFVCDQPGAWTFDPAAAEPAVAWHVDATPDTVKPNSGSCTLNFNNGKDFSASTAVKGTATSKKFSPPKEGKATVTFFAFIDAETSTSYDKLTLQISADGFQSDVEEFVVPKPAKPTWTQHAVPLTKWLGKTIALRFAFDSVDSVNNSGAGAFIDDVVVEAGSGAAAQSCVGRCGQPSGKDLCGCDAACVGAGTCCIDAALVCTGCKVDADCGDGNQCTKDTCTAGSCANTAVGDGTVCDDGSVCTTGEACKAGLCGGATSKDCNDNNVCTWDLCDAKSGCSPKPAAGPCDDGNPCTVNDICSIGTCAGAAKKCDDGNTCTNDACDAKSGACTATAVKDGATCADGDACTDKDACAAGQCKGVATVCNDAKPCTIDACDPKLGCTAKPADEGSVCQDGDACTGATTCKAGACIGKDLCQSAMIAESLMACDSKEWTLQPAGQDGADGKPGKIGWAIDKAPSPPAPKSGDCTLNFNNGVNFDDAAGLAGGTATWNAELSVPQAAGAQLELWSYADTEASSSYDKRFVQISSDGFVASVQTVQVTGNLKEWALVTADLKAWLGKKIKVRLVFDSIDGYQNTGAGWFVDDVRVMRKDVAACGGDADCQDGDLCAKRTCQTGKCVSADPKADGTACDDGNPCTVGDGCVGAVCQGQGKACADSNPCTWDWCQAASGVCASAQALSGTPCGDGKTCNALGACK